MPTLLLAPFQCLFAIACQPGRVSRRRCAGLIGGALCCWLVLVPHATAQPVHQHEAGHQVYEAAVQLYDRGQWVDAADAFEAYLERAAGSPKAGPACFFLVESLMQLGEYRRAHELLCALTEDAGAVQEPFQSRARFRKGQVAYLLGLDQEAEQALNEFHRTYPESELAAYALPYLADLARKRGDFGAAATLYGAAMDRSPRAANKHVYRFEQAKCYQQLGNAEAARAAFAELQKTASPNIASAALYSLGLLEYSQGSHDAAIEHLANFTQRFPDDPRIDQAHYWLGIAYLAADRHQDATSVLTLAEELCAQSQSSLQPSCWFYLAEALCHVGEPDEARWRYERLVNQVPEHERAADAREALNRLSPRTTYRLVMNPIESPSPDVVAESFASVRRATQLVERGLWSEALTLLQATEAEASPGSAAGTEAAGDATLLAGRCLVELGRYEDARQCLRGLLVQPAACTEARWAEVQFLIASSYHRAGQSSRAAREFLRIDALVTDELWRERSIRQASRCFLALGRVEAAEQLRHRAEMLIAVPLSSNHDGGAG